MRRDADDAERIDRFHQLFGSHYTAVLRFVRRRVPSADSDDVVAEIFTVAWRRLEAVPSAPDDRLWLYAVARRTVAQARRTKLRHGRLRRRVATQREGIASGHSDPAIDRVHVALAKLRKGDRDVLELFYWEDLSQAEIARVLDCSEAAVAQRLSRARKRLRDRLVTTPSSLDASPSGSVSPAVSLSILNVERTNL